MENVFNADYMTNPIYNNYGIRAGGIVYLYSMNYETPQIY